MDDDPINEATDSGLLRRFGYAKRGQTSTLRGSLYVGILRQERPTQYKVNIRITLSSNKPEYFLMSPEADTYSIRMITTQLDMVKVGLHPSVLNGQNVSLNSQYAKYPMHRTGINTFTNP